MDQNTKEVGFVQSVRGSVAYLDGLPSIGIGEIVRTASGTAGFVGSLYEEKVEVFLLSDTRVEPGEMFARTGEFLDLPVGEFLLGRAINSLGEVLDGGPAFAAPSAKPLATLGKSAGKLERMTLEQPAVNIEGRRFIDEQFDTGITAIDTIFPIGKGQRELVIGDQRSGKTQFLLDTVSNLKDKGVICVYGMIGKPVVETRDLWLQLVDTKLIKNVVLVMTTANDPAPMTFLAPMTAMTVAQYFQRQGKDVLVILDDMGVAARNYREMALVSNRPPGRESYPGDIFFQHARLLERAGCFNKTAGGGSITALPVIELILGEFAAFIPTNLMGMTDGHLLFRSTLSQQGKRPAVDLFLSVTRVGGQTQKRLQNSLATKVKEILARGSQLEMVSRFGSELPTETKLAILQKQQVEEILNQKPYEDVPKEIQTILLSLPFTSWLKGKEVVFVKQIKGLLLEAFKSDPDLKKFASGVFSKKDLPELFGAIETLKPQLDKIAATIVPEAKVEMEKEG